MMTKNLLAQLAAAAALLALCHAATAADVKLTLSGEQETPAVTTSASGSGTLSVDGSKNISGTIRTTGLRDATAAHIHTGAAGQKGPPVLALTKVSDGEWTVPPDSALSDDDYANFKAGKLYVNIHTAANKSGEIRGQIVP